MSASYNDGTVQYGTVTTLTLLDAVGGATFQAYVPDNISTNRPTKDINRTNAIGEPSGSVGVPDFVTGSATLQMASSSTKEPVNGKFFTITLDATIGSENFVVTSVGRAEQKDSEKKFNVTFKKVYN